jgi:hypothetical protein
MGTESVNTIALACSSVSQSLDRDMKGGPATTETEILNAPFNIVSLVQVWIYFKRG